MGPVEIGACLFGGSGTKLKLLLSHFYALSSTSELWSKFQVSSSSGIEQGVGQYHIPVLVCTALTVQYQFLVITYQILIDEFPYNSDNYSRKFVTSHVPEFLEAFLLLEVFRIITLYCLSSLVCSCTYR
ncbi:hypothetical protein TNIN_482171 [Trichonephila inaurata madagascariensis]|uniref:Uncharacterized protein n=1 Tax=Trichonephila inaurata madagascariensis TaxID=2747483 RepID=A0A8X6XJE3_9ARAC|nr:hypothetical protein TNIN_482171 [Trichonephila inaurata madagascariensis]